jgi:hypothetical protein
MRTTAFAALLFASTLIGTAAAQTAPPNRIGVTKMKRISIANPPSKHTSRPHISESAKEKAPATKRVSIVGPTFDYTSRPRISQSSGDGIRRVSIVGPISEYTPQPGVPLPDPELLNRLTAPDCEFKSAAQGADEVALRIMKLDYERQCYRQSEFILRARMERLQDAVSKIVPSVKRGDRASAQ